MNGPLVAEIQIVNKLGLHARAAAKFVKLASTFQAKITLVRSGQEADGKSIMSILMLTAEKGSSITLKVEGPDQEEAFGQLRKLIADGFGE